MFGHDDEQHEVNNGAHTPVSNAHVDAPAQPSDNVAPAGTAADHTDTPNVAPVKNDDLLAIKQSALKQLSPLVSHLDQSAEEKFHTTMMMIQAADDQTLIKDAYEAAQNIADEKARAQALLDIVNEINYFTQHSNS
ncbi:hypothetical protein BH09PAT4_BH09PAT4_07610 [soil metagenome]